MGYYKDLKWISLEIESEVEAELNALKEQLNESKNQTVSPHKKSSSTILSSANSGIEKIIKGFDGILQDRVSPHKHSDKVSVKQTPEINV